MSHLFRYTLIFFVQNKYRVYEKPIYSNYERRNQFLIDKNNNNNFIIPSSN